MRISGTGIAHNGMDALKRRSNLYDAKAAISALHDALLAVAKGDITPEQVRDFFWRRDLADAKYFGDVLDLELKPAADRPTSTQPTAGIR